MRGGFGVHLKQQGWSRLSGLILACLTTDSSGHLLKDGISKTSTFHLPLGDLGITLDDVQCLLHLPIQG
ncbi:serine/threonine-protein phosphatase 7 long form-like protein, partial [Trifolium medium]|nr:serine/threonine-protein phosphatase 7 long form-like protein [Trifolium medium]